MDKFTVEQKAKAYDKALEKAQSALKDGTITAITIAYLQDIFPELKESEDEEDEKIRTAILNHLKKMWGNSQDNVCGVHVEDAIAWLEKQGWQPRYSIGDVLCDKSCATLNKDAQPNFEIVDIRNGMYICDKGSFPISQQYEYELVAKKIEQNLADKVESKFHEGDWVIDNQGIVHQISNVIENVTNHTYGYDIVGGGYFNDKTEGIRLWTIKDAKDGDVLVASDGSIFLFAGAVDCACKYYVVLTACNNVKINKEVEGGYWETSRAVHPATKEQRDAFFANMKEAGYEWDAEKKILKEIENEIEIPFGAKDSELQEATYYIPKFYHAEIDNDKVVIKKGEKPAEWSKDDERICQCLIRDQEKALDDVRNDKYGHSEIISDLKEMYRNRIDWLKSVRPRIMGLK